MQLRFAAALCLAAVLVAVPAIVSVNLSPPKHPLPVAKPVRAVVRVAPPKHGTPRIESRKDARPPSAFEAEERMSPHERMQRWSPLMAQASKRFGVPQSWIRAVMLAESGGRTMAGEGQPITSSAGAMGLMQLMPSTYADMRVQYGLGADPYDPHDNVIAGAAYLRWLRQKYDYPAMFAAYNDGPGNLEQRLASGGLLPRETQLYLVHVTESVEGHSGAHGALARLTRPNGAPVLVDCAAVVRVRAALPDEYAPGVLTVVTIGRLRQGVRETPAKAIAIIRAHGGAV
jgi:membrane-bound lytic murein transglycosylase B